MPTARTTRSADRCSNTRAPRRSPRPSCWRRSRRCTRTFPPPSRPSSPGGSRRDARAPSAIGEHGTIGQHGQRVDSFKGDPVEFTDPQTVSEAAAVYKDRFKAEQFTPDAPTKARPDSAIVRRVEEASGKDDVAITFEIDGVLASGGGTTKSFTNTIRGEIIPSNAMLLAEARAACPAPQKYAWRVVETHSKATGKTTRQAVGERVLSYLHHQSLDATAGQHFHKLAGEDSAGEFYTHSTYTPDAPIPVPKPAPLPFTGDPFKPR